MAGRLRIELAGKGTSVYTVSSLIGMLYDKLHSIINIFIHEYLYLLLIGYIFGVILVCIFVYPLYSLLSQIIDIPYKTIGIAELLTVLVRVLAVNLLMMGISVSFSFIRIIKQEPTIMAEEQV